MSGPAADAVRPPGAARSVFARSSHAEAELAGGARSASHTLRAARLARETALVMGAVSDVMLEVEAAPPEALFPAHLSVALIDAVFGAHGGAAGGSSPARRYCRDFELTRMRPYEDRWCLPALDAQERLSTLVSRYERLGVEAMAETVFEDRARFPGTRHSRAGCVVALARALRHLGVDTLQDFAALHPEPLGDALCIEAGFDAQVVRSLASYAGGDDFVWGDGAVRGFVAGALGGEPVSAAHSELLVRRAAFELVVSPRHVDYLLWRRARKGAPARCP